MDPRFDPSHFLHRYHHRVRSHDCDRQGVVHNARYLEMFEIARVEYARDVMQIPMDPFTFVEHHRFFFVRNALDYYAPARFDEEVEILTRVSQIGRTSITLNQVMRSTRSGSTLVEAEAVMVKVSEQTNGPEGISELLREMIGKFEKRIVEV